VWKDLGVIGVMADIIDEVLVCPRCVDMGVVALKRPEALL
jgi:hypothetical protein